MAVKDKNPQSKKKIKIIESRQPSASGLNSFITNFEMIYIIISQKWIFIVQVIILEKYSIYSTQPSYIIICFSS